MSSFNPNTGIGPSNLLPAPVQSGLTNGGAPPAIPWAQWFNRVGIAAGSQPISPLQYAGKGDGITDDTGAVQAAIAQTGYLYLPAGYTFLVGKITITRLYALVFGGGTLKARANLNDDLLFFDGTANVIGSWFGVLGVTLDGNRAAQSGGTGSCLVLRNAAYAQVAECYIHDGYQDGIFLQNYGSSSVADEVNIINNRIFNNNQQGIEIASVSPTGNNVSDHLISYNHINYNGAAGIYAQELTSTIIRDNNVLTNTLNGITLADADRVLIAGNMCRNNGGSGMFVLGAKDLQVIGNGFHYNNAAVAGTASNLDLWGVTNVTVIGNYCGDTDFTPRALYGIQLGLATVGTYLSGNIVVDNASGSILDNGLYYRSIGNKGIDDGPISVARAAAQTIGNGANTTVTFDTNVIDQGYIHSTSVNPTRFTAHIAGRYDIHFQIQYASAAGSYRYAFMTINGVAPATLGSVSAFPTGGGVVTTINFQYTAELAIGDYVEFVASQNSGGALAVVTSQTWGSMRMCA